ncbi:MAG: DUF4595 domain-containing protein [Muribaculaceae bacterium]|nr:DUF4595 domain-containing protein [Muribaculaceae bacterium]
MKKFLCYLLVMVAICGVTSCSSDDEPGKIELSKGQSSALTLYANNTSGEIRFNAAASWSAWISTTSRAPEEISWLTLNITHGSAGEVTLSFTLERNTTGISRTAYIIIVCEDEKIEIKITQRPEDDPDDGSDDDEPVHADPLSGLMQNMYNLSHRGFRISDLGGNLYAYDSKGLVTHISGNRGACTFDYSDAPNSIVAQSSLGQRYVISLNVACLASHIDVYYNNVVESSYDFEYDNSKRFLTKVIQYKNGRVYETSELTWDGSDISEVRTTYSGGVTTLIPAYSDIVNSQLLMLFDTQLWIDIDELECFYYCGIFGYPTYHLISSTTATEVEDGETYRFSSTFNYTFDSNDCPIKIVYSETEQGEGTSTTSMDFAWSRLF